VHARAQPWEHGGIERGTDRAAGNPFDFDYDIGWNNLQHAQFAVRFNF